MGLPGRELGDVVHKHPQPVVLEYLVEVVLVKRMSSRRLVVNVARLFSPS
jgi:hypothetical protein